MVYTTKFYLIYDDDNNPIDYAAFCKEMFDIQRDIRTFKNLASSEYFSYMMRRTRWKEEHGAYPTDEELLGDKIGNILYRLACDEIPSFYRINANCVSRDVMKYFKTRWKDIISGKMSIPAYKSNQPINIHNKYVVPIDVDGDIGITLSLLSSDRKKALDLETGMFRFKVWHKCESSIPILHRCLTGEYKIGESSLQYDKSKRMWELALSYHFEKREHELDPERILGIDLGICIPVVVAVSDSYKRLFVRGNEVTAFREKTEAMRRQMSRARVFAGEGSVGHGRNTRAKPVDRIGHRIANFRNTKNDAWSREIVRFAVKNQCGTIQMEDLSGISSGDAPRFLKNWTYFDLQQKIKYKAEAEGIRVVMVAPKFTSQRCSRCGYISSENRPTQEQFVCQSCGYTANADYNAARNLAIKNIDQIIKKECEPKANRKS